MENDSALPEVFQGDVSRSGSQETKDKDGNEMLPEIRAVVVYPLGPFQRAAELLGRLWQDLSAQQRIQWE